MIDTEAHQQPPTGSHVQDVRLARLRILAFAPNSWFGAWMNRQQLLSRLGRLHDIVYSTGIPTVWDIRSWRRLGKSFFGTVSRADNVRVESPPRYLIRWPTHHRYDRAVLRIGRRRYNRLLEDATSRTARVLYLFHPNFADYVYHINHDFLVYHAYDLFSEIDGWNEEANQNEQSLLKSADLIIASSQPIADVLSRRSNRTVRVVPNGADIAAFLSESALRQDPVDIADIPHPRIGYVGRINQKIDLELLDYLTAHNKQWQVVLIGPIDNLLHEQSVLFSQLRSRPNFHILGDKLRADLPAYTRSLDVGLLCYRSTGSWAKYGYPLKLHEYLAAGLPVVSADLLAVQEFRSVLEIADSPEKWQTSIELCIDNDETASRQLRQSIAKTNDWQNRADLMNCFLSELAFGSSEDT